MVKIVLISLICLLYVILKPVSGDFVSNSSLKISDFTEYTLPHENEMFLGFPNGMIVSESRGGYFLKVKPQSARKLKPRKARRDLEKEQAVAKTSSYESRRRITTHRKKRGNSYQRARNIAQRRIALKKKNKYFRRKRQDNTDKRISDRLVDELPSSASSLAEEETESNYENDEFVEPEVQPETVSQPDGIVDDEFPNDDVSNRLFRSIEQYPSIGYDSHAPNPSVLGYSGEDYHGMYRKFNCKDVQYPGYYADMSSGCEVFHVCEPNGRHHRFICPAETLFNQKTRVCDWWYNVYCAFSDDYFNLNREVFGGESFHSRIYSPGLISEPEPTVWSNSDTSADEPGYRSGISLDTTLSTNSHSIKYGSMTSRGRAGSEEIFEDSSRNQVKVERSHRRRGRKSKTKKHL